MKTNPVPAADVQIGDTVTVQFAGRAGSTKPDDIITATGRVILGAEGDLMLGHYIVAHANGNPGPDALCVTSRLAAEPPLGTVVKDDDGDYWAHLPEGWCVIGQHQRDVPYTWAKVNESYTVEAVR